MRRVFLLAVVATAALAACTKPAPKKPPAQVQADASAPRTCREWTIDTATLRCSADVLRANYQAANAKRIAAADDKLSRYNALAGDVCKDAGGAWSARDDAVGFARADATTRIALDKTNEPSAMVALCHDAVIKIVSRSEENGRGRAVLADLHPNVDDTPKEGE